MIGKGAQYLTAAGFGRYRITAASLGSLDLLGTVSGWLSKQARQAIMAAFGVDGQAVIAATNEYLNGIAASDKAKAQQIADFMNESPTHAVGYATFIYEYQEVEYIQGTGTQWIKTDIPFGNYEVELDVVITGSSGQGNTSNIWGCRTASGQKSVVGYMDYLGYYRWSIEFSNSTFTSRLYTNIDYNLRILREGSNVKLYANDTLVYNFNSSPTCYGNITLFATVQGGTGAVMKYNGPIKGTCAGADVYVIPCYHKTNGTIGMYDVVNNKFYENSGTGTFLKGPDV